MLYADDFIMVKNGSASSLLYTRSCLCLYSDVYSISYAAVSTHDYAFDFNDLMYTHFTWKCIIGGRIEVTIGDMLTHTEGVLKFCTEMKLGHKPLHLCVSLNH